MKTSKSEIQYSVFGILRIVGRFSQWLVFSLFLLVWASLLGQPAAAQPNNGEAYTWTTLAGIAPAGAVDGIGSNARFDYPWGIARDGVGNLYVVDRESCTIRKVAPSGVVTTIAGLAGQLGSADGVGRNARFWYPVGVVVDHAGNVYVADWGNNTIRRLTPVGTNWVVTTIAGSAGEYGPVDGTNTDARFAQPWGLTVDTNDNIFVTDGANEYLREISPSGSNWVTRTIITNVSFSSFGIAVDGMGNLYVADYYGCTIERISAVGTNWEVSIIAGQEGIYGSADGTGTNALFQGPNDVAVDNSGNLIVADTYNNTIRKITPVGTDWVVSTLAGSVTNAGSADGTGTNALFNGPYGLTVDGAGNIFVTDTGNSEIRKVASEGVVTTVAGSPYYSSGSNDGTGAAARFNNPFGIAVDNYGNLYVTDSGNDTIRQVTSAGVVSTLAGLAGNSGSADGVGSYARFYTPYGIAVDNAGNVFVADCWNDTIRRLTSGGRVSTIASNTFKLRAFNHPAGVAVDSADNVFVAGGSKQTILKITPIGSNWVVSIIAGLAGTPGDADGTNSDARFSYPYGITVDGAGNLFVADSGSVREITPSGTNWITSTIVSNVQPVSIAVDTADNLLVTCGDCTICKIIPVGTNWVVSTIGGLAESPGSADGVGSDARFYGSMGIAVDNWGNVYVADTYNNTIRKGMSTAYGPAHPVAYTPPPMSGQLMVMLLPPEANGQWRFPWDQFWRNSGDVISNLVPGNYSVVFRDPPGYLACPSATSVAVFTNATTCLTNEYYPTIASSAGGTGSLVVGIAPNHPAGSGWRFIGETTWRAAYTNVTGLLPDTYYIEFAPVSGWSRPASQAVPVAGGQQSVVMANYILAQTAPDGVMLPQPVPTAEINDMTNYPFGYNGQLLTDLGYGSGVAVSTNVVLTAAHLVFNDQTLSYVDQAYWYFQREAGVFEPQPQAARGWYMLSGYASQRTNDMLGGLSPDQSSPQSRNLDVAALYFNEPCAGGGSGGYLPSDEVPNTWLTSTALKMLVGYPVDGSQLGDASIVPGMMYQTQPQPYALSLATDPVDDQQVYVATWFLSYPGNSGGPLYVQMNGYYYPAGVYLGTLYSGAVPYGSAVRAIDSNVVALITLAQNLGDSGTNNTGGGVITLIAGAASASHPAYVQVVLGPASAVAAGAGWRLQGDASWGTATNYTRAVTSSNAVIEFKSLNGWEMPTNQSVSLTANQVTVIHADYSVMAPVMVLSVGNGAGITGTTGTTYRIEYRTNLLAGDWLPLCTNTISSNGFNPVLPWPLTNGPAAFYRAVWLP